MTPRAWLLTAVVVVSNVAGNLLLLILLPGTLLATLLALGSTGQGPDVHLMWTGTPDPSRKPDSTPWIALGGFLASFIIGLPGWILVMKKRVLQCAACGAVTPAS